MKCEVLAKYNKQVEPYRQPDHAQHHPAEVVLLVALRLKRFLII